MWITLRLFPCPVRSRSVHIFRKIPSNIIIDTLFSLGELLFILAHTQPETCNVNSLSASRIPHSFAACLVLMCNPHSPFPPPSDSLLNHSNIPLTLQMWDLHHCSFFFTALLFFFPWTSFPTEQSNLKWKKTSMESLLLGSISPEVGRWRRILFLKGISAQILGEGLCILA